MIGVPGFVRPAEPTLVVKPRGSGKGQTMKDPDDMTDDEFCQALLEHGTRAMQLAEALRAREARPRTRERQSAEIVPFPEMMSNVLVRLLNLSSQTAPAAARHY
jgi:hypothetical protein